MYVEDFFRGVQSDMLNGPDEDMCLNQHPSGYGCTRGAGHDGNHRAGTIPPSWSAEWDDDRSTDGRIRRKSDESEEFFTDMGL